MSGIPRPRAPRIHQNYFENDKPSREEEDDALIAATLVLVAAVGSVSYGLYKAASWGYSYFKKSKQTGNE